MSNPASIDLVKNTRGARSEKDWRRGWSLALVLVLGGFAAGTGCWAADGTGAALRPDGTPESCGSSANQGDTCTYDCTSTCGNGAGMKYCRCEGGVYIQCPCLAPEGWMGNEEAPYCDKASGATSALVGNTCDNQIGVSCVGAEPDYNTGLIMQCSCEEVPSAVDPSITFPTWVCKAADEVTGLPTCESIGTGIVLPNMKDRICPVEWETCIGRDYDRATETPKGCWCEKQPQGNLEWNCGSTNKWFRPAD